MRRVGDLLTNRIHANLAGVRRSVLVDLPADRSFTLQDFLAAQAKFLRRRAELMAVRCPFDESALTLKDVL